MRFFPLKAENGRVLAGDIGAELFERAFYDRDVGARGRSACISCRATRRPRRPPICAVRRHPPRLRRAHRAAVPRSRRPDAGRAARRPLKRRPWIPRRLYMRRRPRSAGIRPSISASTYAAFVGLGLPERLALGAASGTPAARMTAAAAGWTGMRTATVGSPAETPAGTRSLLGNIMVRGPGQNALARRLALSGTSQTSCASSSMAAIWTISGLSCGRPFAANILATADSSKAFAASP